MPGPVPQYRDPEVTRQTGPALVGPQSDEGGSMVVAWLGKQPHDLGPIICPLCALISQLQNGDNEVPSNIYKVLRTEPGTLKVQCV